MELSSEDSLRLNVLIANAEAIRIDENNMAVYGLSGEKEMKVPLHCTGRSDHYLAKVRELLSGAVLDSPGGYPVYLRRWTRMGQIDNDQMDRLLMLGEPEAVMAVVCSPGLTDELARRAWWSAPYSEYARRMLTKPAVVNGTMGPILAEHLVEHLPFETEHADMLETVRLVLQPGLISEEGRQRLWDAGRSKKTYRVGFLRTVPDALPEPLPPRHDHEQHRGALTVLAEAGNPYGALLGKLLDSPGQTFFEVALEAMRRPADQDVVSALLNAIGSYFADTGRVEGEFRELEAIYGEVERRLGQEEQLLTALRAVPSLKGELQAALVLAHVDEAVVTPIFAHTDAVGSVMRKKIEPVTSAITRQFEVLKGTAA